MEVKATEKEPDSIKPKQPRHITVYPQKNDNSNCLIKLLIVGNAQVGKTSLLSKFSIDVYSPAVTSTLGLIFVFVPSFISEKRCKRAYQTLKFLSLVPYDTKTFYHAVPYLTMFTFQITFHRFSANRWSNLFKIDLPICANFPSNDVLIRNIDKVLRYKNTFSIYFSVAKMFYQRFFLSHWVNYTQMIKMSIYCWL